MLLPLLVLATMQPRWDTSTGAWLNSNCISMNKLSDDPKNVTNLDWDKSHLCMGYIRGVIDTQLDTSWRCRDGISAGDFIHTYLRVMRDNPDLLEKRAVDGVLFTVHTEYPCPLKP